VKMLLQSKCNAKVQWQKQDFFLDFSRNNVGKVSEDVKMKSASQGLKMAIFMQLHYICILQKYICNAIKRKENNRKQVFYSFSL